MGQDEDKRKLMDAARTLLARGEDKFSITGLCAEAGVDREAFRDHFTGKAALLAALETQPAAEPQEDSKAVQEPGIPTPDAWLERRLRVLERALSALEAKSEATARDHARAIADLEDKLIKIGLRREEMRARTPLPGEAAAPQAEAAAMEPAPAPEAPAAEILAIAPVPVVTPSREEMADVLRVARGKAHAVPEEPAPKKNWRLRWLAIGCLSLAVLFVCIGLSMGNSAGAVASDLEGGGVSHRHVAGNGMARTIAQADAGDAHAAARLALAYIKGAGVARDAQAALRWSQAGAQAGLPFAQYLLGTLYDGGEGVAADHAQAFKLYAAAADEGNLKAMHNLAIAYAEGLGTAKDEGKAAEWFARAAERGYLDSAFDLAVLYERGAGVPQDLKQALKWYAVAAFAGDVPSQARVAFLRTQMKSGDVSLAMNAAGSFMPLPSRDGANSL